MTPELTTPGWVQDAIFYQIFPDRFASSPKVAKPHNLEPWDSPPTVHGFKGGDLLGIAEHLDYLQDLGITAIYLNPIFESAANHRYHTHDYYRVDPILGGDAAFRVFLDAAQARGMRVILDGVFNHASRDFLQFSHALENGAASPYLDWFTFKDFPVRAYEGEPNYACWFNLPALPKLNIANPQVRDYLWHVAEYWTQQGIDGWRLDVPEEIDDDLFWQEFRQRVRAINPDAYIVGEIWHKADRWLQGDQFDAVMDYQFTRACISFFIEHDQETLALTKPDSYGPVVAMDAPAFAHALEDMLQWYPQPIVYSQLNLLDSHDTARFLTIARGDVTALKLAWLAMFAYPGAPMIYYGDEIGMQGGDDPESRGAFPWDHQAWNYDLLTTAKRFIALRKKYAALRQGEMTTLYAEGKTCVFARSLPGERIIVALNAAPAPVEFDLPAFGSTRLVEEWTDAELAVTDGYVRGLALAPRQGKVWKAI